MMKKNLLLILISLIIINCTNDTNETPDNEQNENVSELFAYKDKDEISSSYISKIIKINQTNGNETTIKSFGTDEYIQSMVFNNSTNEILGTGLNNQLIKINIENGSITTIDLDNSENIIYDDFIMDNENNLFAYKDKDEVSSSYISKIVKING